MYFFLLYDSSKYIDAEKSGIDGNDVVLGTTFGRIRDVISALPIKADLVPARIQ